MRIAWKDLLALVLVSIVGGGCRFEPRREHVHGTVSYDGQPIENGTIELIPVDGTPGPSLGSSIAAGRFDVPPEKGPRPGGTYKVVITAIRDSGQTAPNIFQPGGVAVGHRRTIRAAAL